MLDLFKSLWNWVVTSSEDPTKTSLTWSGVLIMLGSWVSSFLTSHGYAFTPGEITSYVNSLSSIVGLIVMVVGLIRKLSNEIDAKLNPPA